MDVESEIRDLKRRVGELEGTYGFLTGQLRDVHRAVLGFQEQTNERFDGLDGRVDGVDARMGRVERSLDALPRALAEIVRVEFARRDGKEYPYPFGSSAPLPSAATATSPSVM